MKKLPPKFQVYIMPLLLTMIMTAIVSGISTLRAVGLSGNVHVWLGSWLWSWLIAYPTILVVMPFAKRLTNLFVSPPNAQPLKK